MTEVTATKTRRPRAAKADPAVEDNGQAVPQARRRPRPSAGGFSLKLEAEQRPGYVRRFVNGDPNRVLKMEALGYTMVNDRAGEGKARTDSLGTRITRHAGRNEDGSPMHTVLMETPEHEFNYGVADREEARKAVEDVIRGSGDPTGQLENQYAPSAKSTIEHSG
jgi:hypothetical protein